MALFVRLAECGFMHCYRPTLLPLLPPAGRDVPAREIDALVKKLNIQFDNLCQVRVPVIRPFKRPSRVELIQVPSPSSQHGGAKTSARMPDGRMPD